MLKVSHRMLIIFSGLIWLGVGCFLLPLGLNFLLGAIPLAHIHSDHHYPLLNFFLSFTSNVENATILLISLGLLIGYFKGRYVLGKSAVKGVQRICSFPNPTSVTNIYSLKYYILLGAMVGLGLSMKLFSFPLDIRGVIDIAIGSALINGAMIYFRAAFEKKLLTPM